MPTFSGAVVGMERITNGQLRPTFVQLAKEANVEDRIICSVTEHRNPNTIRNYDTRISAERYNRLGGIIADGGGGQNFYESDKDPANIAKIVKDAMQSVMNDGPSTSKSGMQTRRQPSNPNYVESE